MNVVDVTVCTDTYLSPQVRTARSSRTLKPILKNMFNTRKKPERFPSRPSPPLALARGHTGRHCFADDSKTSTNSVHVPEMMAEMARTPRDHGKTSNNHGQETLGTM